MALKNLFLKDYSGVDEDDYSVAVYSQQGVYDSLFYVLDQASLTSHHHLKKHKKTPNAFFIRLTFQ